MKFLILLAIVVAATATKWHELHEYSFEKYVKEFGKKYSNDEETSFRRSLFESNLESIKKHNQDTTFTWKEGVNQFTDRTQEEFSAVLGVKKDLLYSQKFAAGAPKPQAKKYKPVSELPTSVDWRLKGAVTAVKDQGNCGSCWTFGTAETIESLWFLQSGEIADLSEQQILDCVDNPDQCGGTGGCGGGTCQLAYTQIQAIGGLQSEWVYPYISYQGKNFQCQVNGTVKYPMVQLSGFETLPTNEYLPLMNQIALSPVAISVDASAWSKYETGVFNGCNQTNPDIDHAVQLVGYGNDATDGDYWLVRNSWSPKWGEAGYIRVARSANVECGTDISPLDGTGCKGGPATVQVCGTCGILFDNSIPIIAP